MLAELSPNRRLGVKANLLSSISCTEYIMYQNQCFCGHFHSLLPKWKPPLVCLMFFARGFLWCVTECEKAKTVQRVLSSKPQRLLPAPCHSLCWFAQFASLTHKAFEGHTGAWQHVANRICSLIYFRSPLWLLTWRLSHYNTLPEGLACVCVCVCACSYMSVFTCVRCKL